MAGLTIGNQGQGGNRPRGAGLWWVALVLIVLSAALLTLYVRFDGGGAFAVVRGGVQSVTKPLEAACSGLSSPFKSIGGSASSEELEALQAENEQLRTLVAELEEYRQQDERLTSLVGLSDIYGLETIAADVLSTTTGWDRTATINVGSEDGVQVGQGVVSSCGLYGQVESVTGTTAVVRLVNDAESSTSAMLQSTNDRGIVQGSYDGTLTLEYISIDSTVGEGDIVITSGKGGVYPRGIILGTVTGVETDSSMLYYSLTVEPIYQIADCEEVLVLTGEETETASLLDEDLLAEITGTASSSGSGDEGSSSSDDDEEDASSDGEEDGGAPSDGEDASASGDAATEEGTDE